MKRRDGKRVIFCKAEEVVTEAEIRKPRLEMGFSSDRRGERKCSQFHTQRERERERAETEITEREILKGETREICGGNGERWRFVSLFFL